MAAIDVHGARSADTLTATPSEGECWINLILDLDESIKEHGTAFVGVDVVGYVLGPVVGVIWIGSVDIKPLHLGLFFLSQSLIKLFCVINLEYVRHISQADV